ncbi:hypothetical protein K437DRAFT_256527 [Tilletiaria anomala UBC 951]|uniref:3-oxo-5-alpha-steroid 4-dehydrogenase C-terminal domain-containing protein n=1 Tax=Tilletiaria anomala (strain ATCC 24038 / CBS 436.72 / UBC 951) TaxID=1037660 RepID=A0A066VZ85_TILAU|nr:uncharacterized protein K437DRAFT_256527 [Tilletiaria anomala UBC 951]KDN45603.1 hypothetical protein K437DRAFT_256527 [Tilletiaria anomala UBC 951]
MSSSTRAPWLPPLMPRTPADVYMLALAGMQLMLVVGLVTIVIPAPHGKWGPRNASGLNKFKINGNLGWFLMEIWGPVILLLSMSSSSVLSTSGPLKLSTIFPQPSFSNFLALPLPNQILGMFYAVHYVNRAVINPLRSPPRTDMSLIVPAWAAVFQITNGFLLGNWLAGRAPAFIISPSIAAPLKQAKGIFSLFLRGGSSNAPTAAVTIKHAAISPSTILARPGLLPDATLRSPLFWIGLFGAIAGLASNIYHDEILANLRRAPVAGVPACNAASDALVDGKPPARNMHSHANGGAAAGNEQVHLDTNGKAVIKHGEEDSVTVGTSTYRIPRGGLFDFVDHPHYVSEWFEWSCFAIASLVFFSALVPSPSPLASSSAVTSLKWYISAAGLLLRIPTALFPLVEIAVMSPRAIKGHEWYKKTFGSRYPQQRKALIPGIL